MPRIDPVQLLKCLSILLSSEGGIKSRDEVQRLASLMTKFSKKLVSKCIYIQILKSTETELLGQFMGSGGWRLVHMWLTESIVAKNWPLVRELLELLLLCPVDIERLKINNCPKLVKELSKDGNLIAIRALASKLVEQWLRTVKSEPVSPVLMKDIPQIVLEASLEMKKEVKEETKDDAQIDYEAKFNNLRENIEHPSNPDENHVKNKENDDTYPESLPVLKISVKDGKQVITHVDESVDKSLISKNRHKSKNKDKFKDQSETKSKSSKHSEKGHSSSKSKTKSNHKSDSNIDSNKQKTKSSHKYTSSREKLEMNKTEKLNSNSSSRSSSSTKKDNSNIKASSKKDHDKDVMKQDKNKSSQKTSSDEKKESMSISKLGKIPKLSDSKTSKPSISIEVRKPDEPKPKTVKTFNSKFRKHGLEEEIKPPPSRASILNKKSTPAVSPTGALPIRSSAVNEFPPEKKAKILDAVEKPGAIKLIPAKPKPMMLLESDMFMDALNASATNKKEPKKRKRRTSLSKDGNSSFEGSPPQASTSPRSNSESKSVPARFYKDTMDVDEDKEKISDRVKIEVENEDVDMKEENSKCTITVNGLKGVLLYNKKKGPKKTIKWKPDTELEEIQYFELDETERVNVTKTFTDMKYLERIHEREAFQKARNLINDDLMEEKTIWKQLVPIETQGQTQVEYGKNSKEREIQAAKQKGTLQPLYFHKSMIPDSPLEPELETHTYSEPTNIPLEDVTGNQDNISDFRNMPWPEPKGNAPPTSTSNISVASLFPPNLPQFPNGIPPNQFAGLPGFQGTNVMPGEWQNSMPPMMNNTLPGPIPAALPPGSMIPGNVPPGMMIPPEGMMMGPEMFGAPNPMFGMPPEGFNMPPNMFHPDFNMPLPQGPPCPDGFPNQGNFRGGMRGRGSSNHWRGKASGNWDPSHRGRPGPMRGGRKTACIYFQRKGSCRMGENCAFLHPGVNGPF